MFRVANVSGFYPDWFPAMEQQLRQGSVDVLTGDYLAELTMGILSLTEAKGFGYAKNFIEQLRGDALRLALEQDVKIIANAGGLQPEKCARAVAAVAAEQGLHARIAWVEGDDLRESLERHLEAGAMTGADALGGARARTANAYLGCWPIVEALRQGADVVVTGRCTDASPVMAAAAWKFGWTPRDYDALAGALAAGHILECGGQATGGNYPFFQEVASFDNLGFPIAELEPDGSCIITKHQGTGGAVTVDTVKAQLFYEIAGHDYVNPDVTLRLDTLTVSQVGRDRVRVAGARGVAPPATLKVSCTVPAGYRHVLGLRTCGPHAEDKIALLTRQVWDAVGGPDQYDEWNTYRVGGGPAPDSLEANFVDVYFAVRSRDRDLVGRAFADAVVQLALRTVPGVTFIAPPGDASPVFVNRSVAIKRSAVTPRVRFIGSEGGMNVPHVEHAPTTLPPPAPLPHATLRSGRFRVGDVCGARSGDKGADANVGIWVRDANDLAILAAVDEAFVAEATQHPIERIERYDFANLLGRNFVLRGYLGEGAGASLKPDAQAKTLGEFIRAQSVQL